MSSPHMHPLPLHLYTVVLAWLCQWCQFAAASNHGVPGYLEHPYATFSTKPDPTALEACQYA